MSGPVGLVGIGLMGTALAGRMLGAGLRVVGFDLDPARRKALAGMGGRPVDALLDLAACRSVVLCVMNTAQVEAVLEGDGGLIASAPRDGVHRIAICTATCEPGRIAALAERIEARGWSLVDAPVSGSSVQAARGDGLGLVSGRPEAVAAVATVLEAIYPARRDLGPAGNGTRAKLVINLMLGLNRAALAEGLAFAEAIGLDPAATLDVARASAAWSQVMDVKGDKMVAGDVAAQGKISQHLKDVRIMMDEAAAAGGELALGARLAEVLEGAMAAGEGDFDNSAVIREFRRRLGRTPARV